MKRRVRILDHGVFKLFGLNVSLPALIELTEEQIDYIKTSGLYKIAELTPEQLTQAKPTPLSDIEGDRFEHARTRSVNQLAFKTPIMGTDYKEKAKNAIIIKKNSSLLKSNNKNSQSSTNNQKKEKEKLQSNKSVQSIVKEEVTVKTEEQPKIIQQSNKPSSKETSKPVSQEPITNK